MIDQIKKTALSIAGTIADESTQPEKAVALALSMKETMQLASTALALASQVDQRENPLLGPAFTPADFLREMADAWDLQVGEEGFERLIQEFRDQEAEFKAQQFSDAMPEELTVNDILREE